MDNAASILEDFSASQGWITESQLMLCSQYIDQHGNLEDFKKLLQEQADMENDAPPQ